jgi:transposase InsO family protein
MSVDLAQLGEDFACMSTADRKKAPSRYHSAAFKVKVALEAIRGEHRQLAELATKFDVHATQIAQWKAELLKSAEAVFGSGNPPRDEAAGCWCDNVLIERFWRTIKYQEVYLKAYESTSDARANLRRYIDFYNSIRGHRQRG